MLNRYSGVLNMSYQYKTIECSRCKKVKCCRGNHSNVLRWVCEDCCERTNIHWTEEAEDDDN